MHPPTSFARRTSHRPDLWEVLGLVVLLLGLPGVLFGTGVLIRQGLDAFAMPAWSWYVFGVSIVVMCAGASISHNGKPLMGAAFLPIGLIAAGLQSSSPSGADAMTAQLLKLMTDMMGWLAVVVIPLLSALLASVYAAQAFVERRKGGFRWQPRSGG